MVIGEDDRAWEGGQLQWVSSRETIGRSNR